LDLATERMSRALADYLTDAEGWQTQRLDLID
jgi:hypothetical protein